MTDIQAVMVDIGGVVLATHEGRTAERLAKASPYSPAEVLEAIHYTSQVGTDLFLARCTPPQAFEALRQRLKLDMTYEQFAAAWMSMLGEDYPQVRAALEALPFEVPLYTLSNTSELHLEVLGRHWLARRSKEFFVSCRIGLCKPDPAMYRYALERIGLPAPAVLFFDDNARNVAAALEVGLRAVHVTAPDVVLTTLRDLGLIA